MKVYAVIESNMYGHSYVEFFKSKQWAEDLADEYNEFARSKGDDSAYFYFVREVEVSEK